MEKIDRNKKSSLDEQKSLAEKAFRQTRRHRSDRLLGWGITTEFLGIVVLVLAFVPVRGGGDSALEAIFTNSGIFITSCGMLIALVGAFGGLYYADSKIRQSAYTVALLGAIAQITGFTWDNILHLTGHSHFDEAHFTAIAGLAVLWLTAFSFLLTRKPAN
jgi:hypothetical protein